MVDEQFSNRPLAKPATNSLRLGTQSVAKSLREGFGWNVQRPSRPSRFVRNPLLLAVYKLRTAYLASKTAGCATQAAFHPFHHIHFVVGEFTRRYGKLRH